MTTFTGFSLNYRSYAGVQVAQRAEVGYSWTLPHQGKFAAPLLISHFLIPFPSQWNFEKFLVNKEGKVVHRWASTTTPEAIDAEIAKLV